MDTFIVYLIWLSIYCFTIGFAEMIAKKAMEKKNAHRRQPADVSAKKMY